MKPVKTITAISLFVFIVTIVGILTAGYINRINRKNVSVTGSDTGGSPVPILILTPDEVARHNRLSDCWLIISGKVYDVTQYIVRHPGGASAIAGLCGRESTSAFQTKGGQGSNHSGNAYNLLVNYFIGNLNSGVQLVPSNAPGTSSTSLPTSVTERKGY